jgi:hypothetical protein
LPSVILPDILVWANETEATKRGRKNKSFFILKILANIIQPTLYLKHDFGKWWFGMG